MSRDDLFVWLLLISIGLLVLVILIGAPIMAWYQAGVQADVYRRQGVEMTTWEVFMGAKPIERSINIKPVEKP